MPKATYIPLGDNTTPNQNWSHWGKEAVNLINELTSLWTKQINTNQNTIARTARLILIDTSAVIIDGLSSPKIQRLVHNNAALTSGNLQFPGLKKPQVLHDLINVLSAAATWNELVEGNAKSHGRPALHVVPISIALGITKRLSLGRILLALLQGYEVGARFGEAYSVPEGEHVDGTWGTVAATISACQLLDASGEQTQGAVNAALCQMSRSLFAPVEAGATSRMLYPGLAAIRGLQLAVAATADLHGPELLGVPSNDHQQRWPSEPYFQVKEPLLIEESYIKMHPGARHLHYCMEAALSWRQSRGYKEGVTLSKIDWPEKIEIFTYKEAAKYCNSSKPQNRIQAQFSLQYATCICLLRGLTEPSIFEDQQLHNIELNNLLERTKIIISEKSQGRWAKLAITTRNGLVTHSEAPNLRGDPDNPLTTEEKIKKAQNLIQKKLGQSEADKLIRHWLNADLNKSFLPSDI